MLLLIGTLLVLTYMSICIMKVYNPKNKLRNMTGMTIVMVLVMAISLVIGLVAGIAFKSDLTVSTIVAISFSLIVGAIVGTMINLLALVEGIADGMMGAMLPSDNYKLMLVVIDVLFIAIFLFIIMLINTELKKNKETQDPITRYPRTFPWVLTTVFSAVIILTFAQLEAKPVLSKSIVQEVHHHHK